MEGRLLAALLGLCAVLAARAEEAARKEFDFIKFSGLWFEIALASNVVPPVPPTRPRRMGAVLVGLDGKSLALTSVYDGLTDCVKEFDQALQTDTPGKFKVVQEKGNKEVVVQATDYQTYAVLDVTVHLGAEVQRAVKLYSRNFENNGDAIKKFQEITAKQGYKDRDVHLLSPDNTCVKLLQSAQ